MEVPFVFGRIADHENFTDRQHEAKLLQQNFMSLINTVIISPRRWGKTSLVNKVSDNIRKKHSKEVIICNIDIFNCRTEEQFYKAYANAILKASYSAWEQFMAGASKYLSRFAPKISFSDTAQSYELSFGVDLKEPNLSVDEILDLPQAIATETGKRIIICIDEFQNINEYPESLAIQRKLRAHWQNHNKVCYCLYGSKRHLLMNIFNDYSMPFYKFGDILFLQKIEKSDWVEFIAKRFEETGKEIADELCGMIADTMKNHPYYTQQYSQQVWLRTEKVCNKDILKDALSGLIDQLSLLFTNIVDSLTPRQISFLSAIASGETNFSSKEVLTKYNLGTSANIKNLRKAMLEKDLIDVLPGKIIVLQDPAFEYWLKKYFPS